MSVGDGRTLTLYDQTGNPVAVRQGADGLYVMAADDRVIKLLQAIADNQEKLMASVAPVVEMLTRARM